MHKKLCIITKMELTALAYDSGNLLIKHNDKWRGDYYLKDDLSFTTDRNLAARFYILKPGDTTILNGDRVSINSGNRTLIIDDSNQLKLIDRTQHHRELNSFIITNGTDSTDPITYDGSIFFISDRTKKMALRYVWGMDLINSTKKSNLVESSDEYVIPDLIPDAADYKPRDHPNLMNENYGNTCEANINSFQFRLERGSNSVIDMEDTRTLAISPLKTRTNELFDRYKGVVLLLLLMIVLILCVIISK